MKLPHCFTLQGIITAWKTETIMLHYKVQCWKKKKKKEAEATEEKRTDRAVKEYHYRPICFKTRSRRGIPHLQRFNTTDSPFQKLILFSPSQPPPPPVSQRRTNWSPQNHPSSAQMWETLRIIVIIPTLMTCPIWGLRRRVIKMDTI